MEDIDQLIKDFKTAFLACNNQELLKLHFQFDSLSQQTPKLKRKLDFPEYNRFKSELAYLNTVCEFLEATDWYVVTESDGIKVQARGSGSEFFTKCEVTVQKDLFKTLSVLSAADLVPTWVSVCTKIDILAEPTMTRKLTKFHFWFPWPLTNRQCVIEFNAFPIPREKACLITMRTPESENYLGYKIPPFAEGEVKMWVRVGCLYAQMVDENNTKIIFLASADGNIAFLPTNLINYGMKNIMFYVMDELRKKIMAFEGSVYEERIREKPELFDYIRSSIDAYYGAASS